MDTTPWWDVLGVWPCMRGPQDLYSAMGDQRTSISTNRTAGGDTGGQRKRRDDRDAFHDRDNRDDRDDRDDRAPEEGAY
jgi:hypothetical protein